MTTMSSFTEVRLSRPIGCRVMVEKKTSTRFSYGPTTGMSFLWKSRTRSSFIYGEVPYAHRAI